MKTKNLKYKIRIKAAPMDVYNALMDNESHEKITGMKADNSDKAGGHFVQCNGHHHGYNLLLQPGKRIIQSWNANDFPNGHHSVTDWKFEKAGDETIVSLYHYAVPKSEVDHIESGWEKTYLFPLKAYLEPVAKPATKSAKKVSVPKKAAAKKSTPVKKVAAKKAPAKKAITKKVAVKKAVAKKK